MNLVAVSCRAADFETCGGISWVGERMFPQAPKTRSFGDDRGWDCYSFGLLLLVSFIKLCYFYIHDELCEPEKASQDWRR